MPDDGQNRDASADEGPSGSDPDADDESTDSFEEAGETVSHPEKGDDEVYCSSCGAALKSEAEVCPGCGVRQGRPAQEKSPGIAAIASFFVPGLGDIYNGEFKRGGIVFSSGAWSSRRSAWSRSGSASCCSRCTDSRTSSRPTSLTSALIGSTPAKSSSDRRTVSLKRPV